MPVRIRSLGLKRRPVRHADLRWRAAAMLRALRISEAELSILLCDDATIRQLNRRFRRRNKATDVLAFPMHEEGSSAPTHHPAPLLGDVVISIPTASRQAREQQKPIVAEVTFLLAHGLLHLLGHDHQAPDEERRMQAVTDVLMSAVEAARGSK